MAATLSRSTSFWALASTAGNSSTPDDRRVRLLEVTDAGKAVLDAVAPSVLRAQARILVPLAARERDDFMRMLRKLVDANNELSRAPSET